MQWRKHEKYVFSLHFFEKDGKLILRHKLNIHKSEKGKVYIFTFGKNVCSVFVYFTSGLCV